MRWRRTIAANPAPRRLVIRMPNWLGDVVLALPAAADVRRAFPDAALTIAALPALAPLFQEETAVGQQDLLPVDAHDEVERLRAGAFDAIVLLPNSFRSAWTARQARIPERWGYRAGARGPLLTRAVPRPRHAVHQRTYYSELVRGLGLAANDELPRIRPSAQSRERAAALLASLPAPLVGFAPGAAYGHAKRWPPDRVAQVIVRLVRERGASCVLVGAADDREAGRAIESALPPDVAVTNLIGRTDLPLLVGVLAHCHAFVSNDSGAMHVAAAAGVPVTAIFGPTNEQATGPLGEHDVLLRQVFCRPCMLRECPIDHRCMKRISADDVFTSVESRL